MIFSDKTKNPYFYIYSFVDTLSEKVLLLSVGITNKTNAYVFVFL